MDSEEIIRTKLETLKDSIIGFKFAIDSLQDRADECELEIKNCQQKLDDLKYGSALNVERITAIQTKLTNMDSDIRSVRNSVLAAIATATIITVVGTAFAVNNGKILPLTQPSIGKNA